MKRYFEFQDSKSYKFWQVEVEGKDFTVTYGKIGTPGLAKVTSCASPEDAKKKSEKLVSEKVKKGYVEKAEVSSKKIKKRIALTYDEMDEGKSLRDKLKKFLQSSQAPETESLVIGAWEGCDGGETSEKVLAMLCDASEALPNMKELFVGDMSSEECEVSWIEHRSFADIFQCFPQLERLHIKGAKGLVLSNQKLTHANLKALTIECGGLSKSVIAEIANAKLPKLEYLQLYLGVKYYGFDGSLDDLQPLMKKKLFPKLKHLGLPNSEIADQIAEHIASAPVLDQLESLDLSQGVLTDTGAQFLLDSPAIKKLKRLDLHYHFMSTDMAKQLASLPLTVDVSSQQKLDEDRYPAITE